MKKTAAQAQDTAQDDPQIGLKSDAFMTDESAKTPEQRAEDMAYTINHALACTATDVIDPYVGKLTQRYLGKRYSVGCGGDHHEGSHWQNWAGEILGDFGAVPLTVAVQRYAPWAMDALRYVTEPILGDFFRHGAKEAAKQRLSQSVLAGLPLSSDAYQQYARDLYRYEMQHMPQGLVWTGSSIGLNIAAQKILGNPSHPLAILTGKLAGSALSTGLLFGVRGLMPDLAHKWDAAATNHVFLPATKFLGRFIGVKEDDVRRMAEKKERMENQGWTGRVAAPDSGEPAAAMPR